MHSYRKEGDKAGNFPFPHTPQADVLSAKTENNSSEVPETPEIRKTAYQGIHNRQGRSQKRKDAEPDRLLWQEGKCHGSDPRAQKIQDQAMSEMPVAKRPGHTGNENEGLADSLLPHLTTAGFWYHAHRFRKEQTSQKKMQQHHIEYGQAADGVQKRIATTGFCSAHNTPHSPVSVALFKKQLWDNVSQYRYFFQEQYQGNAYKINDKGDQKAPCIG